MVNNFKRETVGWVYCSLLACYICCAVVCIWYGAGQKWWHFMKCFVQLFSSFGLVCVGNFPSQLASLPGLPCICRFSLFERSILNVLFRLNLGDCRLYYLGVCNTPNMSNTGASTSGSFASARTCTCVWRVDGSAAVCQKEMLPNHPSKTYNM